ncbi:hypothetical protein Pcinc_044472 [Petrolisthes cinctipes]|uniref:Uncharacterized protein n=1 Tax=Petrolisthes cinctipes TaxID=88211 RepID=A0AAE1BDV5_PETCI|nr:hypothetical protein Pcinc_044472 [Petrolisthes cinctipes]
MEKKMKSRHINGEENEERRLGEEVENNYEATCLPTCLPVHHHPVLPHEVISSPSRSAPLLPPIFFPSSKPNLTLSIHPPTHSSLKQIHLHTLNSPTLSPSPSKHRPSLLTPPKHTPFFSQTRPPLTHQPCSPHIRTLKSVAKHIPVFDFLTKFSPKSTEPKRISPSYSLSLIANIL